MSNGEESGKTGRKGMAEELAKTMTGKETLSEVLQRLSASHKGDTVRMRAALALAMLDGSLDVKTARLIGDVINGSTV